MFEKERIIKKEEKIVISQTNYLTNEEFTQQSGIKNSAVNIPIFFFFICHKFEGFLKNIFGANFLLKILHFRKFFY